MKKLSLLIAMILCVTIGGVYANWVYLNSTDVADETVNMTMNLTEVAYSNSNGSYKISNSLVLTIDPAEGTSHTTSLKAEGSILITFTPNTFADKAVKDNAVESTWFLGLTNPSWTYDDGHGQGPRDIIVLDADHAEGHEIVWTKGEDGVFSYTVTAEQFLEHVNLTAFNLDTKAKYDTFNTALGNGNISITVSDGDQSGQQQVNPANA
ncbi:MAG: hypothetical protein J6U92_00900 [Clostridia bacterium]|nr:hypothetical protein [Clostridia bacterium]